MKNLKKTVIASSIALVLSVISSGSIAQSTDPQKPNILVIMGDDIGLFNVGSYNLGTMGYKTPNIDQIAKDGVLFTDFYAQQSSTAGRAAFITGQSPIRTGLTKVGLPGAPEGMNSKDPTIAELLKSKGYATGQFGKNHLGDRDEMLPTNHGFDEYFGSLYHLNASEEPENIDYPKDPAFRKKFGPRGVIHSFANGGSQKIEDTGQLNRKRMETIDEETLAAAMGFIDKSTKDNKPFFVWWNATRMHVNTHLKPESKGKTGLGIYADGMVEHDGHVGQLTAKLKELGIDKNTIVIYTTDNGAEVFSWPDGGTTPYRGEKATNWEGGFRVPAMITWPGVIKPGSINNNIVSLEDMMPTLLAATGDTTVKEKLLKGASYNGKKFKVHLDGYNLMPALKDETITWPRKEFLYWTDDGSVAALRYENIKLTFLQQNAVGIAVWQHPYEELRAPNITNLRMDPFERAQDESTGHAQWMQDHMYYVSPGVAYVAGWIQSFREFPVRGKPGSFSLDRVMEAMSKPQNN